MKQFHLQAIAITASGTYQHDFYVWARTRAQAVAELKTKLTAKYGKVIWNEEAN